MLEGEQTYNRYIGTVPAGGSKSVHWYVRGDAEGVYSIYADLQGVMMPFNEEIRQRFEAENAVTVLAGKAMDLVYYVPTVAVYGEDYHVQAVLTNVSDKPIYDVTHEITSFEQYKLTYTEDGVERTDYISGTTPSASQHVLLPGQSMTLDAYVNIEFESSNPSWVEMFNNAISESMYACKQAMAYCDEVNRVVDALHNAMDLVGKAKGVFDAYSALETYLLEGDASDIAEGYIGCVVDLFTDQLDAQEAMRIAQPVQTQMMDRMINAVEEAQAQMEIMPVKFRLIASQVTTL